MAKDGRELVPTYSTEKIQSFSMKIDHTIPSPFNMNSSIKMTRSSSLTATLTPTLDYKDSWTVYN